MELKEVHRLTPVSLLLATSLLTAVESVLPIPPNTEANLLASLAQEDALAIGENLCEAILSHLGSKRAGMGVQCTVHTVQLLTENFPGCSTFFFLTSSLPSVSALLFVFTSFISLPSLPDMSGQMRCDFVLTGEWEKSRANNSGVGSGGESSTDKVTSPELFCSHNLPHVCFFSCWNVLGTEKEY